MANVGINVMSKRNGDISSSKSPGNFCSRTVSPETGINSFDTEVIVHDCTVSTLGLSKELADLLHENWHRWLLVWFLLQLKKIVLLHLMGGNNHFQKHVAIKIGSSNQLGNTFIQW